MKFQDKKCHAISPWGKKNYALTTNVILRAENPRIIYRSRLVRLAGRAKNYMRLSCAPVTWAIQETSEWRSRIPIPIYAPCSRRIWIRRRGHIPFSTHFSSFSSGRACINRLVRSSQRYTYTGLIRETGEISKYPRHARCPAGPPRSGTTTVHSRIFCATATSSCEHMTA